MRDGDYGSAFETIVATLSYWAPSIADCACVRQSDAENMWRLNAKPIVEGACAFAIAVHPDGVFDLTLAGMRYAGLPPEPSAFLVRLLDSIADGRIIQRRWVSSATGVALGSETLITLRDGREWRGGAMPSLGDGVEYHDKGFLPYRRDAHDGGWV